MGTETTRYRIVLDDKLSPGIKKATQNTRTFDNTINKTNKNARSLGGTLGRVFGGLAIAAGVYSLGKSIITLGANMEQTRVSFGTFLGDVEKGNALIKQLTDFANVTPFETNKVLDAGKTLLGFGLEANKVLPTLKMLGDVSAGTGKDLKELGIIFGQIRSAGRLMGQDALQLINAGFNPLQLISEQTGKSMLDLKKDMEAGLISFDMVEQAFKDATSAGGLFFNLTEKQSKTLGGRWSTLVGKLQLLGATIGEQQSEGLGGFLKGLTEAIDTQGLRIMGFFDTIATSIGFLGDSLVQLAKDWGLADSGAELFGKTLSVIGFSLGAIITSIGAAIESIGSLGLALAAVGQYSRGNIAGGDALLGLAGSNQTQIMEEWANNIKTLGEGSRLFGDYDKNNQDKEDQRNKIAGLGGSTNVTTGINGASSGASQTKAGSAISGIQSKVRNITINIQEMVGEINFNNITGTQSEAALVESVKRALLTAVSDVNVIAR